MSEMTEKNMINYTYDLSSLESIGNFDALLNYLADKQSVDNQEDFNREQGETILIVRVKDQYYDVMN